MIINTKAGKRYQFTETVTQDDVNGQNVEAVWTSSENERVFIKWFEGDDVEHPTVVQELD